MSRFEQDRKPLTSLTSLTYAAVPRPTQELPRCSRAGHDERAAIVFHPSDRGPALTTDMRQS
jgi:hypothetical protein